MSPLKDFGSGIYACIAIERDPTNQNKNKALIKAGQPGETEEEVVQDTNHSDHSLHVLYNEEDSMVEGNQQEKEGLDNNRQPQEPKRTPDTSENIRRKKVKWPNNKSKSEWQQFDEDVDAILNTTLAGNIDRKIESMTSFIYNIGMDRFGADEKEVVTLYYCSETIRSPSLIKLYD
ncbi:unnamed protein product [Mytilus edulis]|uniref:Uncharacterized protein n=1 Tax=Mytilus edulis TaxID=6550 RepID=A0A8S3U0L0_MYTED|nr:unnamed protein product [Mytilus edulis]